MSISLSGRAALVMGVEMPAARAVAVALAEAGADVAVAATRDVPELAVAAHSCANEVWAIGRRSLATAVEATDADRVEALVERVVQEMGRLDVLVNGHDLPGGQPLLEISPEEWRRLLEANLTAIYLAARAAGRAMLVQGGGRVINLVRWPGEEAAGGEAYSIAKEGVLALTRALGREWRRHGIAVNMVGYRAPLQEAAHRQEAASHLGPAWQGLRRAAVYLASGLAEGLSGQAIWVEAGG